MEPVSAKDFRSVVGDASDTNCQQMAHGNLVV
jgi:hypothetical protein